MTAPPLFAESRFERLSVHSASSHFVQNLRARGRRPIVNDDRTPAERQRFVETVATAVVQLDQRIPCTHLIAHVAERHGAHAVIDRLANFGPAGAKHMGGPADGHRRHPRHETRSRR